MFELFNDYNNQLKEFLSTDKASPTPVVIEPQRSNRPSTLNKPIVQFWHKAKTLYKFINSSWLCACRERHQTNLLLQHRTDSEVEFNVLFLYESTSVQTLRSWTWQEIALKPINREEEKTVAEASRGTLEGLPGLQDQEKEQFLVEAFSEETLVANPVRQKTPNSNRHKLERIAHSASKLKQKVITALKHKPDQ